MAPKVQPPRAATVELSIIRLEHESEWSLEVVNAAGTSILWDELLSSNEHSRAEFERAVAEEVWRALLDGAKVIPFPRRESSHLRVRLLTDARPLRGEEIRYDRRVSLQSRFSRRRQPGAL